MDIDWDALVEDEDALLRFMALSYIGLGLYYALRKKPPTPPVKAPPEVQQPPPKVETLSEVIGKWMEETYGLKK